MLNFSNVRASIHSIKAFSRQSLLICSLVLMLGCIGTERKSGAKGNQGEKVLLVEENTDHKELREHEKIQDIRKTSDGRVIVILKKGRKDSLPKALEEVKLKSKSPDKKDQTGFSKSHQAESEASSSLDLPDIFDIFTRIL